VKQTAYIKRDLCPSCGHSESTHFLDITDFRVSRDVFPVHRCMGCGLHYTKLVPGINEIGQFYKAESYDSHRLDNRSFISRVYRIVRGINVRKKVSWVQRYLKSGTVVDYGCGLGHFVKGLQDSGYDASGFEIDSEVRSLAKKELGLSLNSLDDFKALQSQSLDLISMWHVLEHIYELNADFQHVLDKLKSDGYLFIAVPNFRSYDAQYYGKNWEAYDVPRHLYHFDTNQVVEFCSRFGLKHVETIPMKFDSYYVSMRSEKNKDNGSTLKGLRIGALSNLRGKKYGYSSHVFVLQKA